MRAYETDWGYYSPVTDEKDHTIIRCTVFPGETYHIPLQVNWETRIIGIRGYGTVTDLLQTRVREIQNRVSLLLENEGVDCEYKVKALRNIPLVFLVIRVKDTRVNYGY